MIAIYGKSSAGITDKISPLCTNKPLNFNGLMRLIKKTS